MIRLKHVVPDLDEIDLSFIEFIQEAKNESRTPTLAPIPTSFENCQPSFFDMMKSFNEVDKMRSKSLKRRNKLCASIVHKETDAETMSPFATGERHAEQRYLESA